MDIQAEKILLAKRLLDTDDESVVLQLKSVFDAHERDVWNDLPDHVKVGINHSREQAAKGLLTPHDEVMKSFAKFL